MDRDDDRWLLNALRGACCGALATVPMSVTMLLIQRLLPPTSREPQEPQQIVHSLLDSAESLDPPAEHRRIAAVTAHFGYGAATGAAYSLVDEVLQPLPARGPLFGLAVGALSYAGWLPAAGILPPPDERPLGRNALLIASHLVWGASLQQLYTKPRTKGKLRADHEHQCPRHHHGHTTRSRFAPASRGAGWRP